MPEAAPRCSGGHEFITDAMLGDIKIPLPMPKVRSIIAKGKYSKFEGSFGNPTGWIMQRNSESTSRLRLKSG